MYGPHLIFAFLLSATTLALGGTLLSQDMNADNPWPGAASDVMPATPMPIDTSIRVMPVGTIDKAGTSERSGAIVLCAEVGVVDGSWQAVFTSGLMAVANTEKEAAKLTLALDLSSSIARPIVARIESFDGSRKRTGGLETTLYPAAPDFFQRSAIDLSSMKPVGQGKFNPVDPFVQLAFEIAGPTWPMESDTRR